LNEHEHFDSDDDGGGKMPSKPSANSPNKRSKKKVRHTTPTVLDLTGNSDEHRSRSRSSEHRSRSRNFKLPKNYPFCTSQEIERYTKQQVEERKKDPGPVRLIKSCEVENSKRMHLKTKKKNMSTKMKGQRMRAQSTHTKLVEERDKMEQLGTTLANGFGVTCSQISGYADQQVADEDGEKFKPSMGLQALRRLLNEEESESSESEDEVGGDEEGKKEE
jgi:hypothetical protein